MKDKLEIKPHRNNIEIMTSDGKRVSYHTIINNDAGKIAQALLDLYLSGWNIDKAISLYLRRKNNHDWIGF